MSGTSLDGLDIVYAEFYKKKEKVTWEFSINKATTIPYPEDMEKRLAGCMQMTGLELTALDKDLGTWFGKKTREFINENKLRPDFIASHGHTVFHQPDKGITLQIGDGIQIVRETGVEVINDFRSTDVALGGQGAPLVPIGDKLLFGEYAACINLGGISNISFDDKKGHRLAYDIGPVNIVLNKLSRQEGKAYDKGGRLAEKGTLDTSLLKLLNALPYYRESPPKSLGYEWMETAVFPLLDNSGLATADLLRTVTEHVAHTIALAIRQHDLHGRVLFTGGGAFNDFLMSEIKRLVPPAVEVIIPSAEIINYKEALVFAFLGVLRKRGEKNCLHLVTGAARDTSGGTIHVPF